MIASSIYDRAASQNDWLCKSTCQSSVCEIELDAKDKQFYFHVTQWLWPWELSALQLQKTQIDKIPTHVASPTHQRKMAAPVSGVWNPYLILSSLNFSSSPLAGEWLLDSISSSGQLYATCPLEDIITGLQMKQICPLWMIMQTTDTTKEVS